MDDVVVIGAGVIGLTTGVCLAEAGLRVRIRTSAPPAATTSAAAGALIGPAFIEPADRVAAWNAATIAAFSALAADPATGVHVITGTMVSRSGAPPAPPSTAPPAAPPADPAAPALPPQVTSLPGFRLCAPGELPAGFLLGFQTTLPVVDMPAYLDYLAARFVAAGGLLEARPVASLAEAAAAAPVVVNCSGVAANDLAGDPGHRPPGRLTTRAARRGSPGRGASRHDPVRPLLRPRERRGQPVLGLRPRDRRVGSAPAGAVWTEERSDEGRRRLMSRCAA